MPVTTTHGMYDAMGMRWQRCRDAFDGTDAVKAKGETYLDKLPVQTDEEYQKYKRRALWYGATARTVMGLAGAVMRKEPVIEVPDVALSHLDDITLTGVPMAVFVKGMVTELLAVGRCGVLVDMPATTSTDPNVARPYWTMYTTEQILNWKFATIDGTQTLVRVVLKEYRQVQDPEDEFNTITKVQYRVLLLENGVYVVRIYIPRNADEKDFDIQEMVPTFRGVPLDEIPFCCFGVCGLGFEPEKPPLLDLVDANYSHYCSSADLEHGRHYTALPTPWVAGFSMPQGSKLEIGSAVAWVSSDPNAKAGMLEFTGQGLGALETALETKQQLMAVLGARLFAVEKAGVESYDTAMFRSAGERSVLQSMAVVVGLGLELLLSWHCEWMGVDDAAVSAELNSDYTATPMSSQELTSLMAAWQGGAISYETFYYNLQRGEVARPGIEADDERELIIIQQGEDNTPPPTKKSNEKDAGDDAEDLNADINQQ